MSRPKMISQEKNIKHPHFIRPIILAIIAIGLITLLFQQKSFAFRSDERYTVKKEALNDVVTADGKIAAAKTATLNFNVPGKVNFLGVKKGDKVTRYQRLIGLDTHILNSAAIAAQYQYKAADANVKEVEDTLQGHEKDESFSQINQRTAAQTARDIAYEKWIDSRRSIGDMNLYAPFDGIITESSVNSVGDTVGLTDGVTVTDLGSLYFQAAVDETDYAKIKIGQNVKIILDAYPDKIFPGTVSYIGQEGTKSSGGGLKVMVDITLDGYSEPLVTELNGEAEFILNQKQALAIPKDYVISKNNKNYVTVVKDGKNRDTQVKLGTRDNDLVEIISGLNDGDQIVKK